MTFIHEYANPVLTLQTEDDFVNYCKNPVYDDNSHDLNKWKVKSIFVIGIIEDYAKNKFPYNDCIVKAIKILHPELNEDIIGTLVYNAQGYREYDNKIKAGYLLLTQDLINSVYESKKKIVAHDKVCQVVEYDGEIYCKPKYSKHSFYNVYPIGELWVKVIE